MIVFGLGLFPIHELLHAIIFPGGLQSPYTLIGLWPSKLIFYAHYEDEMNRNRFLMVFFMPFFGLSLVPLLIVALFQLPSHELVFLSLVNGAASSVDLFGILLIGSQVPRLAVVRNRGWRSYWKLKSH